MIASAGSPAGGKESPATVTSGAAAFVTRSMKEASVTTYIMLINWTDQGIRNVRDSPKRLDGAKKTLGEMGGSFKAFYLTMGEFDMVAVVEAPDDAVVARFSLQLGMAGSVRTRTMKAFPEAAYREITALM